MTTAIYWFRNDLRLRDNPAFTQACENVESLLPIFIHQDSLARETQWNFPRVTKNRQVFLQESLQDLGEQLRIRGSDLFELSGKPLEIFQKLRSQLNVNIIYCEQIEAPEELTEVTELVNAGFEIKFIWQSSMLDPQSLPFKLNEMPDIFSQFRQKVEACKLKFSNPIDTPLSIPPLPSNSGQIGSQKSEYLSTIDKLFFGGESRALIHIEQYFDRRLPDTYKQTRNQLIGMDYSSKFSPWLALGCCSARSIAKKLTEYENQYGANDGTYWLWFELLWRDYFRFLHFKYGKKLYQSRGLSTEPNNTFIEKKFIRWISGDTGESLVDAGMHELHATGYLSNRMRQIVASYWIYNMKGDWQAGAAWFESQLIDYDVYSNQGNWLYIAGKGTDPRGGRPMNLSKQTQDHDPDGVYRNMWLS
jgi:deoxyribodipyrimidine photo-lyase